MNSNPFELIDTPWGHIEAWRASTLATGTMGALSSVYDVRGELGCKAVGHGTKEGCPPPVGDRAHLGVAEPGCRFQKRLQDRLQIERRAADHLEHVGRGGLLLQ